MIENNRLCKYTVNCNLSFSNIYIYVKYNKNIWEKTVQFDIYNIFWYLVIYAFINYKFCNTAQEYLYAVIINVYT